MNAKQPEQSALQADPSRCESGHGHFQCGVMNAECGIWNIAEPRDQEFLFRTLHSEFRICKAPKV